MTTSPIVATCPWCGHSHELATSIHGDAVPEPGDITLCMSCGEWSIFSDSAGTLRKPTDAEFSEIGTDKNMQAMRRAWVKAMMVFKQ
jgi:hypothetical protein